MGTKIPTRVAWAPHPGPQTAFLASNVTEILYGGAAGGGKALDVDTPIPTPGGWCRIGDLRSGDLVFGADGQPCRVVHAFDPFDAERCYRVTFDDGSSLDACADHKWRTFDATELAALTRRTDAHRERRRARRPRRGTGARPDLTLRNKAAVPPVLPPPSGTVRTTEEIATTLITKRGRKNHAIRVTMAIAGAGDLPLDPYILGVWLGDGTTNAGSVTSADIEILEAVAAKFERGRTDEARGRARTWSFLGLRPTLRRLGVFGRKHVPGSYLRASEADRLALLEGLMDTDGTATRTGSVEFTTTCRELATGVHELVVGLGWKVRIREGRAKLRGVDHGPKWTLKWTPDRHVFRLARKAERQRLATRRTTRFRYVVTCERIAPRRMRCIAVDSPDRMFLAGRAMVPTHNSDALLVGALRLIHEPSYRAVLFRRTYPELEDSLIGRAWEYYPALGGVYNSNAHRWTFPSGAQVLLRSMQHPKDRFRFKSAEFQYVAFDELTSFEESQYRYLFSRLRSSRGLPCVMRAGSNPGGEGHEWVLQRWAPWLYPDPKVDPSRARPDEYAGPFARPGIRRWFKHDPHADAEVLVPEGTPGSYSRTFIPATVEDNPAILDNDPDYVVRLKSLDRVERARLLGGDWMMRGAAGEWFDRSWFEVVPRGPGSLARARVRYWDRAATEAEGGSSDDPDWTAGALLATDRFGTTYLEDIVRFRGAPHVVERRIRETAERDARDHGDVLICLEQDPGQAGKFEIDHYIRRTLAGFNVRKRRPQGNKIKRAKPVSAQAEHGTIKLVRGPWNAAFLDEAELFPVGHDDQIDAVSGGYAVLLTTHAQVAKSLGSNPYSAAQGGY